MLDLSDSYSKLSWAAYKLDESRRLFNDYMAQSPMELFLERSQDTAADVWVVELKSYPPQAVIHLVTEYAAALRSALNFAAWQVFVASGGHESHPDRRRVDFPICADGNTWRNARKSIIQRPWPQASEYLASVQPYKADARTKQALTNLSSINNYDKHQKLHLVGIAALGAQMTVQRAPEGADVCLGIRDPRDPLVVGRQWISCCVYSDGDPLDPRPPWVSAVARWEGMDLEAPPPPSVKLGLLGAEVVPFNELEEMHTVVGEILTRMQDLEPPSAPHHAR